MTTARNVIDAANAKVADKHFRDNAWGKGHIRAWTTPQGAESGIVDMIVAWAVYADRHRARYESLIGDDGVLGPAWANIGESLIVMLNGELGRLDAGTLWGLLDDIMRSQGWEREE